MWKTIFSLISLLCNLLKIFCCNRFIILINETIIVFLELETRRYVFLIQYESEDLNTHKHLNINLIQVQQKIQAAPIITL